MIFIDVYVRWCGDRLNGIVALGDAIARTFQQERGLPVLGVNGQHRGTSLYNTLFKSKRIADSCTITRIHSAH